MASNYTLEAVTAFFREGFAKHGDSPRALEWSPNGQAARFDVCCQPLGGFQHIQSVLDLGCGLGHLAKAIPANVAYTGIDACPELIAHTKTRHPTREWRVADVLDPAVELPHADLVVANGVLNLETGDNEVQMTRLLFCAFAATRLAVAVTALSLRAPRPHTDGRHYYAPDFLLSTALALTPRVILRHDYLPNDCAVYLYRESGR